MRILFISYLFQPHHEIGAVRPSNLCRWLAEFGHEVTVITNNPRGAEAAGKTRVCAVGHSRLVARYQAKLAERAQARREAGEKPHGYGLPAAAEQKRGRLPREAFYLFRVWAWDWVCQADWTLRCRRYMRRHLRKEYDVILSSFGPLGSLFTGSWARRRGYAPRWIADMRDPVANDMELPAAYRYSLRLERRTLRQCSRLAAVSEAVAEHFRLLARTPEEARKPVVIENGFEAGDPQGAAPLDGVLRIAYTGQLYAGRSDPSALFEAVRELTETGAVPPGGVEIHYAGKDGYDFREAARRQNAERFVREHGMLPRGEALALQEQSDILCVLAWNTRQSQGILTGKFWEYLRAGKPVLSIVSGEVPDAELSCRVREMRLGFAYEYAAGGAEDARLRAWLQEAWRCKSGGRPVPFDPDRQKVLEYRYDNRARRMEEVCLACAGKERRKKT